MINWIGFKMSDLQYHIEAHQEQTRLSSVELSKLFMDFGFWYSENYGIRKVYNNNKNKIVKEPVIEETYLIKKDDYAKQ